MKHEQNYKYIKSFLEYYDKFSTDGSLEEEKYMNNNHNVEDSNIPIEEQQQYVKIGHDINRRVNKAKTYKNENNSVDGNDYVYSIKSHFIV